MGLPFKYADFSNNMGRGLTQREIKEIMANNKNVKVEKLNQKELLGISREVFEAKGMDLQSLFYDIPTKEFNERKGKLNKAESQIRILIRK